MGSKPNNLAYGFIFLMSLLLCGSCFTFGEEEVTISLKKSVFDGQATLSTQAQGGALRGSLQQEKNSSSLQNNLRTNNYFPYDPITGYIEIYEEEGNSMFYWLSRARENPDTAPVIIWLEGGPGGSSVGTLFSCLGPLEVKDYPKEDKRARIRELSWNQKANVVFPDYPLGTGFSINTEEHVALAAEDIKDQMLRFYQGFLEKHPEFKGRPIYVAGESYGGHAAPYTAEALKYSDNPDINVVGLFISSGLISGQDMFGSYPEFALLNKNFTKMNQTEYQEFSKLRDVCVYLLKIGPNKLFAPSAFFTCENFYYIKFLMTTLKKNKNFQMYYMPGDFPVDATFIQFLNSSGVKEYLKVRKAEYTFWNQSIFSDTLGPRDFGADVSPIIGRLLDDGVRAVVVDGTYDFICNYQQEEKSITNMNWQGKTG